MRMFAVVLTVGFSILVAAPCVSAQTAHAVSPSLLDAAVQRHLQSTDADRQMVQNLLNRADVRAVAEGAGIDIRSVTSAVRTMDPANLADAASQARVVDQALAGGQSKITVNTTYVIIGLLLLILIIVAVS